MKTLHKKIAIISIKDVSKKDSKLIIDTLKSLGGRNTYRLLADSSGTFYFIDDNGCIYGEFIKPKGYSSMTLDELKKVVKETAPIEKTPVVESTLEKPNTKVAIKSDGTIEHGTIIISHLISLGGVNEIELLGTDTNYYYYINGANNYINRSYKFPKGYTEISLPNKPKRKYIKRVKEDVIKDIKVAIKGDGTRSHGNDIINYLKSLGGVNSLNCDGSYKEWYYYIEARSIIKQDNVVPKGYKEIFIDNGKIKEVITPIEHQSDVVPVEDQKGTTDPVKPPFVEGWYYVKQHGKEWEMRYVIAMGVNDRPIVIGNHTASIHKSIIDYFNGQSVECLVFNDIKPIDSKLFNLYNQQIQLQLEIDKLERELKIK